MEAFAFLFLSLPKITTMKFYFYLFIILTIFSSCKKESEDTPAYSKDYGSGMYIVTENGISFYDGEVVKNQIYKKVNGSSILNGKKIKFNGTKAYIITDNQILTANVKTFENKEEINGFTNVVDLDFISHDRLFILDKNDSKLKVVDLTSLDIIAQIETGDSTRPVFIVSNAYKSFALNGGGETFSERDSTVISVDYRDQLVPLADFSGSINLGYNPISAVHYYNPTILCKGVYNINDHSEDIESSIHKINGWDNSIINSVVLSGVYNANNLAANNEATFLYFTAHDGIYKLNSSSFSFSSILVNKANVMRMNYEIYPITDSTFYTVGMLYMNDMDNPSTIFKYNLYTSTFQDTIVVDGNVKDINFYQ